MEELEQNLGSLRALQLAPLLETKKVHTIVRINNTRVKPIISQ